MSSGEKTSASIFFLMFLLNVSTMVTAHLQEGYYKYSCPSAEAIVRKAVKKAVYQNPGIAAGLIRLHFHDCFVRGCDASVLLNSTKGERSEKESVANLGLRGFEVIDEAKAEIEATCPNTVSCADILTFAARDSALLVGGIYYGVPAGRRDGRISLRDDPLQHLPAPVFNVTQLIESFARKGLSAEEMVALSGAHSIGVSACSSFSNRLFSDNNEQDPSLPDQYAKYLRRKCSVRPSNTGDGASQPTVPLDFVTPNALDNQYYQNLKRNGGLLTSDQTLMTDPSTAKIVRRFAKRNNVWAKGYAEAMVHMSYTEVLTGSEGEIRTNCWAVNRNSW